MSSKSSSSLERVGCVEFTECVKRWTVCVKIRKKVREGGRRVCEVSTV
jgi:hypothetical protein